MQPTPDPSIFRRYTHNRYVTLKTRFPSLGRRALLLLIADEFWGLDAHSWAALIQPDPTSPPPPTAVGGVDASNNGEVRDATATISTAGADDHDADDADDDDDDAAPPGVVLRTDYSAGSDEAWASFCGTLRDAEREFLADQKSSDPASAPDDDGDVEMVPAPASHSPVPAAEESGDDDDEGEGEEGGGEGAENELALFSLVSDSARFDGISNLRALRLLFDVSVRAAPTPPSPLDSSSSFAHPQHQQKRSQQQKRHQHRLACQRGLQETYDARGRTLWIFDARSRIDGCARLVSEAGDVATGDSWRARATHMAELQASLAARALRIDFGGLDRWDYAERQRDMREADLGYTAALSEMK